VLFQYKRISAVNNIGNSAFRFLCELTHKFETISLCKVGGQKICNSFYQHLKNDSTIHKLTRTNLLYQHSLFL